MYVSQFTTVLQTSEKFIIPEDVKSSAASLQTKYMDIDAVIKSPHKSRVSFKGKIVKVCTNITSDRNRIICIHT